MIGYALVRRLEPSVDEAILVQAGEHKILEVKKHWTAAGGYLARVILASAFIYWITFIDLDFLIDWYWVLYVPAMVVILLNVLRVASQFRDRFIITNQRVFRVTGLLTTRRPSIPITRIGKIDVVKPWQSRIPWLGKRLFGYGHLELDTPSQMDDEFHRIKHVGDIDEREKIIFLAIRGEEVHELVSIPEDDGT